MNMKHLLLIVFLNVLLSHSLLAQLYAPEVKIQNTNGNIGIDETNPKDKLHVNGSIRIPLASNVNGQSHGITTWLGHQNFLWKGVYINSYGIGFYPQTLTGSNGYVYEKATTAYISSHFGIDFFSRNTHVMRISWEAQNVGIGTSNPQYKLHVNGSAYCTGAQWVGSDVKLKKNITDYKKGLDLVERLNPIEYELKSEADSIEVYNKKNLKKKKPHKYVSVVAQELQKEAPNLVDQYIDDQNEETLAINQTALTYVLINAVKELHAKLEEQQLLIEDLRKKDK